MKKKVLPVGTTGIASRDICCLRHTIKKGSRITITGVEKKNGYEVTDEQGNRITQTGFDCIIPDNG